MSTLLDDSFLFCQTWVSMFLWRHVLAVMNISINMLQVKPIALHNALSPNSLKALKAKGNARVVVLWMKPPMEVLVCFSPSCSIWNLAPCQCLGKHQDMPKALRLLDSQGGLTWNSWLLTLAWPSTGHCDHVDTEPVDRINFSFFSLSLPPPVTLTFN